MKPPSSPSANRHAAPRAHCTDPDATVPAHTRRRCACPRYFTRSTGRRATSLHRVEQKRACHAAGQNRSPHNSQNRGSDATHRPPDDRGRRHPKPQYRRLPCVTRNSRPHAYTAGAGVSGRPSPLVAAVGTACHAEGRGFESLHPLPNARKLGVFVCRNGYVSPRGLGGSVMAGAEEASNLQRVAWRRLRRGRSLWCRSAEVLSEPDE